MKATEFWFWKITDEFGRRRKSPCRATEDHALSMWGPSATRIEGTCEVRQCPETDEERAGLEPDTGGYMRESRERANREGS